MGCLGNLLWFVFGGALSGLSWCLAGCLWCVTIVGIPIGMQCFKFASLSFFPFGKDVQYGGGGSFPFGKYYLADPVRPAAGVGTRCIRMHPVCDHHRDSLWPSAF